ncbi:MAG TPA: GNAT family N-acetyltransferase [Solirubrobacterales bacterium]|nr:GNAT family N-acetyltransferase [Solirubrobacterales bacterium]
MLVGEVITDVGDLGGDVVAAWDRLAGAAGRPQMAPAWTFGWLRHLAPAGTEPRIVVARDGGEVVGVAPFYVAPESGGSVDYRLANIETSAGLSPLAEPGRERDVAEPVAAALAGATPRPDLVAFEGLPLDSPWPRALRDAWPGRPRPLRRYTVHPSPSIAMAEDDFEAWLAAKSSNFRQQMRRARRKFEKEGGTSRRSEPADLAADAETFVRLHAGRWEGKEKSSNLVAFGERLAPMLTEVGEALGPERFRLRMLELGGEPVAALIFLVAGGHALYLNCGWDERFARHKPAMLALLDAVEESFARGDAHVDLGLGREPYKLRFADGDDPVAWTVLLAPGPRLPLTAARMGPTLARAALRDAARNHLSPEQIERLRSARGRLRR